ncbi:hypothetical protein BKA67DRAFT_652414 [Truncatella angustata]|uniref:Uncharacterized protein n=1 Tax=Truncatella angustata TaxID=152316 RepID=A0A9P9A3E4_9PEZI|nr:uncharacterized protein BKA67DRAFT_652414 [Truncatella angustata]KAH6659165.1 hypothetical protein BKA67DRAFT_652414 [Truncatella angustata]
METWLGPKGYIIGYLTSGGRDFNTSLSHYRPRPVTSVEKIPVRDSERPLEQEYLTNQRIRQVISLIEPGSLARWPLIILGPRDDWCSVNKNVVLMEMQRTVWSTAWLKAQQRPWKTAHSLAL